MLTYRIIKFLNVIEFNYIENSSSCYLLCCIFSKVDYESPISRQYLTFFFLLFLKIETLSFLKFPSYFPWRNLLLFLSLLGGVSTSLVSAGVTEIHHHHCCTQSFLFLNLSNKALLTMGEVYLSSPLP